MNDRTDETAESGEALAGSPGARLRQAREAAGLDLVEVAAELNVRPQLVEALEGDDVSAFPAQVYARGLLRNYARLLGLDPESLLLLHAEMAGLDAPPLDSVRKVDGAADGERAGQWLPILAIAVLVLLSGYALYRFNMESAGPVLPSRPTTSSLTAEGPAPAAGERHGMQGEGERSTAPQGATDETPDGPAASPPAQDRETAGDEAVATDDELLLIFDADSWVEVRDAQGQRLLSRTGKAGQQLRLRGRAPFDVRLGYAPGVRIEYNGKPFASPAVKKSRVAHFQVGAQRP